MDLLSDALNKHSDAMSQFTKRSEFIGNNIQGIAVYSRNKMIVKDDEVYAYEKNNMTSPLTHIPKP